MKLLGDPAEGTTGDTRVADEIPPRLERRRLGDPEALLLLARARISRRVRTRIPPSEPARQGSAALAGLAEAASSSGDDLTPVVALPISRRSGHQTDT
jgi:hypothetical protein